MLRTLTWITGVRIAMLLAYVAGCLAPSAAMAIGFGDAICLDEIVGTMQAAALAKDHANVRMHVHADGTVHYHADHKAPGAAQGRSAKNEKGTGAPVHSHDEANCCGLFGFSAVLPQLGAVVPLRIAHDLRPALAADCLVGCAPDRIDRPPIAALLM
jgi:hypothetical protein